MWARFQLVTMRGLLRIADLIVLVPTPRLLWAYLHLFWLELRHSPYRWPRSFETTLARKQSRQAASELVYGETPVVTGLHLFRCAGVTGDSRFVDLGAGRGRALIAARRLGASVHGVELVEAHVRLTGALLERVGIRLEAGDAADADIEDATHVLMTWTGLRPETRERFVRRLRTCRPGTRVITIDEPLEAPGFAPVSKHDLPFVWGYVPVWVQELC